MMVIPRSFARFLKVRTIQVSVWKVFEHFSKQNKLIDDDPHIQPDSSFGSPILNNQHQLVESCSNGGHQQPPWTNRSESPTASFGAWKGLAASPAQQRTGPDEACFSK